VNLRKIQVSSIEIRCFIE